MYTEAETEKFYDAEDGLYRSFWDSEGSLHWGYFDNLTSTSKDEFLPACKRWNEYMLSRSNITNESKVLDIGCGNGNTAVWLAQQTGCEVVGIDISQVRVDNAKDKASEASFLSSHPWIAEKDIFKIANTHNYRHRFYMDGRSLDYVAILGTKQGNL